MYTQPSSNGDGLFSAYNLLFHFLYLFVLIFCTKNFAYKDSLIGKFSRALYSVYNTLYTLSFFLYFTYCIHNVICLPGIVYNVLYVYTIFKWFDVEQLIYALLTNGYNKWFYTWFYNWLIQLVYTLLYKL